jgi:hypothetical protein
MWQVRIWISFVAMVSATIACRREPRANEEAGAIVSAPSSRSATLAPPMNPGSAISIRDASLDVTPATTGKPAVLNHTVMLGIADGTTPLLSLVDAKRGVVFIDDSGSGAEHYKPRPSGIYCGGRLKKLISDTQRALAAKGSGLRATYQEERLSCFQKPALECVWRGAMEYDPTKHYYFRRVRSDGGDERLELRGIAWIDELLIDAHIVAQHRREVLDVIEAQEAHGCGDTQ